MAARTLEQWLAQYSDSHRHPLNRAMHAVCVPAILWAILALLWTPRVGGVRVAYVLIALAAPFYVWLGLKAVAVIGTELAVCVLILQFWPRALVLWPTAAAIFLLAWTGQFIGHRIEGRRPKFLQDLTFLLIGPLWVVLKRSPIRRMPDDS